MNVISIQLTETDIKEIISLLSNPDKYPSNKRAYWMSVFQRMDEHFEEMAGGKFRIDNYEKPGGGIWGLIEKETKND